LIGITSDNSETPVKWADTARAKGALVNNSTVSGPPILPYSPYGTVMVNGLAVADGTMISAWCGGVKYAQTATIFDDGASWYSMDIPGDEAGTTEIEGCYAGQPVRLMIGGSISDQTPTWQSGVSEQINLNAYDLYLPVIMR
jgi:hypothetical protein